MEAESGVALEVRSRERECYKDLPKSTIVVGSDVVSPPPPEPEGLEGLCDSKPATVEVETQHSAEQLQIVSPSSTSSESSSRCVGPVGLRRTFTIEKSPSSGAGICGTEPDVGHRGRTRRRVRPMVGFRDGGDPGLESSLESPGTRLVQEDKEHGKTKRETPRKDISEIFAARAVKASGGGSTRQKKTVSLTQQFGARTACKNSGGPTEVRSECPLTVVESMFLVPEAAAPVLSVPKDLGLMVCGPGSASPRSGSEDQKSPRVSHSNPTTDRTTSPSAVLTSLTKTAPPKPPRVNLKVTNSETPFTGSEQSWIHATAPNGMHANLNTRSRTHQGPVAAVFWIPFCFLCWCFLFC